MQEQALPAIPIVEQEALCRTPVGHEPRAPARNAADDFFSRYINRREFGTCLARRYDDRVSMAMRLTTTVRGIEFHVTDTRAEARMGNEAH